jgi:hypothetical protein
MNFLKTKYEVSIPENCVQSWDEMSPNGKGRHCQFCSKTVIDFSMMSEQKIIEYLKTNKGNLCGRFTENQLKQPLLDDSKHWSFSHLKALLGLIVLSISKPIFPQDTTKIEQKVLNTQTPHNPVDTVVAKIQHKLIGQVVDSNHVGYNNAILFLINSPLYTRTDYNGNFELSIPDSMINQPIILKVHYNNPEYQLYNFKKSDLNQKQILYFTIKENKYHSYKIGVMYCNKRRWWQFWKWF